MKRKGKIKKQKRYKKGNAKEKKKRRKQEKSLPNRKPISSIIRLEASKTQTVPAESHAPTPTPTPTFPETHPAFDAGHVPQTQDRRATVAASKQKAFPLQKPKRQRRTASETLSPRKPAFPDHHRLSLIRMKRFESNASRLPSPVRARAPCDVVVCSAVEGSEIRHLACELSLSGMSILSACLAFC